jgi:hypothetical protein
MAVPHEFRRTHHKYLHGPAEALTRIGGGHCNSHLDSDTVNRNPTWTTDSLEARSPFCAKVNPFEGKS